MTEAACNHDAIRTPRSRGKADGTLHEVKPVAQVIRQERPQDALEAGIKGAGSAHAHATSGIAPALGATGPAKAETGRAPSAALRGTAIRRGRKYEARELGAQRGERFGADGSTLDRLRDAGAQAA